MNDSLKIQSLRLEYPDKLLFDDINLTVAAGSLIVFETNVLDGATSLLKGIAGMLNNIQGQVWLGDSNLLTLGAHERATRVGFVYEEQGLISLYNVFQNIALPLEFHTALNPNQMESRVLATLDSLSITPSLLEQQPHELNDVQTRLVNLARALVIDPQLLLIDELEGGMPDDMIDRTIAMLINRGKALGSITLMTSSHERILREADRVLKIDDKQLRETEF
jgi:ABC-type transporter Mla maintaining outer membrane lipid asymmetry ATPase subunit MlaF